MNVEYNDIQTKKDKTTRMMISPAHFDEVVKHSPLRVLKSYDLCEQVMCRRARCQERSFQLEDLIRGKWGPLLLLRHPLGHTRTYRYVRYVPVRVIHAVRTASYGHG